ncbi:MAG: hypothetical protein KatS3mg058_2274 [Roseiflexus sp.]|nr:MAG: hypothetical protein KatS3mg058_2274 [Roseiflexus sp.]
MFKRVSILRGGLNTRAHPSTPTGGRTRARGASPPAPRVGGSGRVQRCSCVLTAARLLSSTKDTKVHEAPTIPRCPLGADRTPARIPARLPGDEPARAAQAPLLPARGGFWAGTTMLMRADRRAPSLIHEGHEGPRSADNPPLPFKGGPNTRAHPSTPIGGRTRARGASPPAPRVGGSGRVQRCSCVLPALKPWCERARVG